LRDNPRSRRARILPAGKQASGILPRDANATSSDKIRQAIQKDATEVVFVMPRVPHGNKPSPILGFVFAAVRVHHVVLDFAAAASQCHRPAVVKCWRGAGMLYSLVKWPTAMA